MTAEHEQSLNKLTELEKNDIAEFLSSAYDYSYIVNSILSLDYVPMGPDDTLELIYSGGSPDSFLLSVYYPNTGECDRRHFSVEDFIDVLNKSEALNEEKYPEDKNKYSKLTRQLIKKLCTGGDCR